MNTLQRSPVIERDIHGQRTGFDFGSDDDLSMKVSIYLDSQEGSDEIVGNVAGVLQAYGFTRFKPVTQAPGSWFISIEVGFKNTEKEQARKSKQAMEEDLGKESLPTDPKKAAPVKKLKKSLLQRLKKKGTAILVAGATFLGGIGTAAGTKLGDKVLDAWIDKNGPVMVQKADELAAKKLPPAAAEGFHYIVKDYIEKSDQKKSSEPPSGP